MVGRPRLLRLLKKQVRLVPERKVSALTPSDASTGVAGHVSNSLFIFELLSVWFHRIHIDPFGTEFYVSRGGSTIRVIRNPRFEPLQRSFQLLPQLLAAAC